ncbi:MAG TPA: hypothetical protein PK090_11340 [Smithellaceae bacterium]|nr:hypothetical protein [Smithellaceae bacterium]
MRIQLPENPANLPQETLERLGAAVTASLREGYLPCPVAWRIAKDFDIPHIAVGAVMDKLGVRVTDCQIGFFKVDKTPYRALKPEEPSPELTAGLHELDAAGNLTCPTVFELARRFNTSPLKVSEAANILGLKIRACQLGCF